jgi:zinc transport system substrate-binding protein
LIIFEAEIVAIYRTDNAGVQLCCPQEGDFCQTLAKKESMSLQGKREIKARISSCSDKSLILFCLLSLMAILSGLSEDSWADDPLAKKPIVYTVSYPLQYFAERIVGHHATVVFPAPAGVNPAFWTPDVKTIAAYQQADLVLLNGANYAKWIDKVTLRQSKMVNTSAGFKDQYINAEEAVTHSHGPGGEHSHSSEMFTTWLDSSQAVEQAEAVRDALIAARLGPEEELVKNYESLRRDLLALDMAMSEVTNGFEEEPLFTSHPVYDYLGRRYKLNIKSLFIDANGSPDDLLWEAVEYFRRDHPASWVIWESKPRQEMAEFLEARGIRSVVFDPCSSRPDKGDFLTVMQHNIENLRKALE